MTDKQAEEYRAVVAGDRRGWFHMWVEKVFDDQIEVGGPSPPNAIMRMSVQEQDCRALIEHTDGSMGYYKPEEIKFIDRT